jgi:hypothetical protein
MSKATGRSKPTGRPLARRVAARHKAAVPPSQRLDSATAAEKALESLLRKLLAWLFQQPEWMFILSADRRTRKEVGRAIGDMVSRIPPRSPAPAEEEK